MKFECTVCGYVYNESTEKKRFFELPENWVCPICGAGKSLFKQLPEPAAEADSPQQVQSTETSAATVADELLEGLSKAGVHAVFGMVGHSNLGISNALRKLCEHGKMRYVGIRHEGAAAFACSAYGKLTGRPAACLSIAGPGASNLLTGLCDASLDAAPAIALTGQIPSADIGAHIFQELDIDSVLSASNPYSQTLGENSDAREAALRAVRNAVLKRGVSQITVPDDIQKSPSKNARPDAECDTVHFEIPEFPVAETASLKRAATFVSNRKYPVMIIGFGAKNAVAECAELAELLGAPIVTTYRAKGFISDTHPLVCGVAGRSGTPVANAVCANADCFVAVGTGFSRHSAFPTKTPVVQIDTDSFAFGRRRKAEFPLLGDAKKTVAALAEFFDDKPPLNNPRKEIAKLWADWRAEKLERTKKSQPMQINPTALCDALSKFVPANAIVSVDVGNVAYVFGRSFEAKNQRFLLSFYLGSIGCGLPAAMGAWCAAQEKDSPHFGKKIVAVVGDGGLGQYLAEWTTAVKNKMDIVCVVLNNSELAKISEEERNAKMPVWETELLNPSFAEFSKLCGGRGILIDNPDDLDAKLAEAFSSDIPTMVEVKTSTF